MPVEFLGKEVSGRFTIPSGIVATEVTVLQRLAHEIPGLGILTTKSISDQPREGNREPIFAQVEPGTFINAVGLTNPGADLYSERLTLANFPRDRFVLASIIGQTPEEFSRIAQRLIRADGFELNISCPHAGDEGVEIGKKYELVTQIVSEVRRIGKPVLVKLSPRVDIERSVEAALSGNVDGFTAINTDGPRQFMIDDHPVLSNKVGGFSGKFILERGIEVVTQIRSKTNLPIIGCGGISTALDVIRYRNAGANIFGIGSALVGMSTVEIASYFKTLNEDVDNGTNFASNLIKEKLNMDYQRMTLVDRQQLAPDLALLTLDQPFEARGGQFAMLWLPEKGEKPFSVYNTDPCQFLIQRRGCFTEALIEIEPGQDIYVRGPYGNPPLVDGRLLLVGGGTGIAALKLIAKEHSDAVVIAGAKDRYHLPDMQWGNETIVYTEDGSQGRRGRVTDNLGDIIQQVNPDHILNCGPSAMLFAAVQKEIKLLAPDKILSSEELPTKCGVGICGRCATPDGLRNCVDGTFFSY